MKNTAAENMVLGQILTNDVLDPRILQTMADTKREDFVPEPLRGAAYVDEDLPVGGGRALLAPMNFAKLLHLAGIETASRVLDVGCLSGYSAAVLARLAAHVVAVENDESLLDQARAHLARLKVTNVNLQHMASLAEGYPPSAPYDVIVIEGAIEFLPETLGAQLAKGGRLVAVRSISGRPDAHGGLGRGMVIRRISNQLHSRDYFDTGATLLPGFERNGHFSF